MEYLSTIYSLDNNNGNPHVEWMGKRDEPRRPCFALICFVLSLLEWNTDIEWVTGLVWWCWMCILFSKCCVGNFSLVVDPPAHVRALLSSAKGWVESARIYSLSFSLGQLTVTSSLSRIICRRPRLPHSPQHTRHPATLRCPTAVGSPSLFHLTWTTWRSRPIWKGDIIVSICYLLTRTNH